MLVTFYQLVELFSTILWNYILIFWLIGCGFWLTYRLKFIQFIHFKEQFRLLLSSRQSNDSKSISSFQALCTTLGARVGTGNLMGVAVAITLGGPGAIFWMWVIALISMATAFAESTLAQLYKQKDHRGFKGGPAYYMLHGVGNKTLAVSFSILLLFSYGFIFSGVQANTISTIFQETYALTPISTASIITLFTAIIVVGGLKRIARFAEWIVPFMALIYILLALFILLINIQQIPYLFKLIIHSAFGLEEFSSGLLGSLIQGLKRGLYSNEAGTGSAPNAAAATSPQPNHPVTQGYIQMLGVVIDTLIICTCTAFIILLAYPAINSGAEGIVLTQMALEQQIGIWGAHFLSFAIFFFCFTSIIANFAYAEMNLRFLNIQNLWLRILFNLLSLTLVFYGALASLEQVINLADLALGLMALINVFALIWLTKPLCYVTQDYHRQRQQGRVPEFIATKQQQQEWRLTPGIWNK